MSGAIAAGHPLTAQAGADVLATGGNAIDACIAAAFVAFVAEGPLAGPTGGGFVLVHHPGRRTTVLDCFFAVPRLPLGEMEEVVIDFADAGTQSFHVGDGSVAVPGLVAGLEEAHRRHGSRPWAELVAPSVALSREGVVRDDARRFLHQILVPILLRTDGGRRVYGDPERVRTAELAPVLEDIRDRGASAVAAILPEYEDDLAAYEVIERRPTAGRLLGLDVLTTPPPSRGGRIVVDVLERLSAAPEPSLSARVDAIAAAYGASARGLLTGTTHVSAMDADGLAVGLSMTLGSGSGVFRGGGQLNNMLGELDVIGTDRRPPGERLPSMMTPTLVAENGRPRLVLGSAGSVRLAGAIAQVCWNVVGLGLDVGDAVAAPRIHVDGDDVHLEGGWPDDAVAGLVGEWNAVPWSDLNLFFGGVSAVERTTHGSLAAAGDPRRGGHGIVVAR